MSEIIRRNSEYKTIRFYPGNASDPILITLSVPYICDPEEYIDAYLDSMLNEFLRYNCEWEFTKEKGECM